MRTLNELDNISQLPDLALCSLNNWALIAVTGEDRITFLQGQLTCDLTNLQPGQQTLAAQCDAQGKVLSIVRVIILEDRVLLMQPSTISAQQLPVLKKYSAFSKVDIQVENEYKVFGLSGSQSTQYIADNINKEASQANNHLAEDGTVTIKQFTPTVRYLILTKNTVAAALLADLNKHADVFDDSLWNALDIASGLGFIEAQTSLSFIPQMLNLQALDGICFTKGCYIGQENIARAKYRGTNKRAMFILSGQATHLPKVGDNIQISLNDNWKRIGTIINACQYKDGHIEVLAVLPKDIDPEGTYQIKEQDGSRLYPVTLPYSLEEA